MQYYFMQVSTSNTFSDYPSILSIAQTSETNNSEVYELESTSYFENSNIDIQFDISLHTIKSSSNRKRKVSAFQRSCCSIM